MTPSSGAVPCACVPGLPVSMRTFSPGASTKPGSMMPSNDFLLEPRRPTVIPQPRVLNGALPSFSSTTHSLLSASADSAALISTNRIAMARGAYTPDEPLQSPGNHR